MTNDSPLRSVTDLVKGLFRHPGKTASYAFTSFSVIFTVVKAITHFIPSIKIEGISKLLVAVGIGVCYAITKTWKPSRVEIPIATCNTIIEVVFGDLFLQEGIRAIAVNEYFDSIIGKPVSEKSIHGIFIQRCFGGRPEPFDIQVSEQLKNVQGEQRTKVDGKSVSYPIGATAMLTVNQDRYIAFAFARTDPQTCKASSDVTLMWVALHGLWQRARIESGGYTINLPLVGSGLSGLGLPTRDLLNLIILSAITETKSKEITARIRIVLHRDRFDAVDLREVRKFWREC